MPPTAAKINTLSCYKDTGICWNTYTQKGVRKLICALKNVAMKWFNSEQQTLAEPEIGDYYNLDHRYMLSHKMVIPIIWATDTS
jgi:hypothetical protein